jgi:hypothetical protein
VRRTSGAPFAYPDIWQRRNLLLFAAPAAEDAASTTYAATLGSRCAELDALETTWVATSDPLPGLPPPAVLVADRWGEIQAVWTAESPAGLPDPQELLEWLAHIQHACPECEGETR